MRSTLFALVALAILPLTSCNLYFSGDDPDPCDDYADWGGGGGAPEPALLLRNPQSGMCESFGWGQPPYPCDGVCGPCVSGTDGNTGTTPPGAAPEEPTDAPAETESGADEAQLALPSWGYCDSYCTGLDEQSCLAVDGCRGIYNDDGTTGAGEFLECWQTDSTVPPPVQSCEGLDAFTCSQLDSCIAVHDFVCADGDSDGDEPGLIPSPCEPGFFIACHDEQPVDGCYGDQDCGPGYSCNAADVCLPPPGGDSPCPPDGSGGCDLPAVCYGYCVPAPNPGECDGEVNCDALPPLCEAGMTPGIADGCWTGVCIDLSTCPQASCGDIVGESMCIARDDCSAYYVGVDCSCTPEGCDCSDWNFDSCNPAQP